MRIAGIACNGMLVGIVVEEGGVGLVSDALHAHSARVLHKAAGE